MSNKSGLKFEEWQRYAEYDRQAAENLLKEGGPAITICFLAQQMAEKYLKGYTVFSKKHFEKQHQLPYLLQLCQEIDPEFIQLKDDVIYLNRFYVETRYPGDMPDFTIDDSQKAFSAATRIKNFILNKILAQ